MQFTTKTQLLFRDFFSDHFFRRWNFRKVEFLLRVMMIKHSAHLLSILYCLFALCLVGYDSLEKVSILYWLHPIMLLPDGILIMWQNYES